MKETIVPDFTVYALGIVHASVCTSLLPEEVVAKINKEHPTGISSQRRLSAAETFASGTPNPCVCHDHPETHKHYLLSC